jgi:hypothetical protein
MFNPNQSIPTGLKVEIGPKGFTLRGVKAEIEKNIFNLPPSLLINAELYGLILAPRLEKGYHRMGSHVSKYKIFTQTPLFVLCRIFAFNNSSRSFVLCPQSYYTHTNNMEVTIS